MCAIHRKRNVWWKIDVVSDDDPCVLRNTWNTAEYFYIHSWRDDENRQMGLSDHNVVQDSFDDKIISRREAETSRV